ncbi:hypothetical protein HBI56_105340 [Parastagonospora nodorum]|nr:hypothetical protein HBH51_067390 [Parastagonospora nodorum]KAH3995807.1 hypothetical protein HBI10_164180 [Parastagonospora nodorum]KAH4021640.1 hypothetical protein HBI13_105410 [Parastagonospora nodorum]KAH4030389.1 hypothetical protein HBI09_128900 [Parastagonospora nodorum]KAH4048369.1 hypothetical protein HBH49_157740 [Parastagonospora nodorum]
MKVSVWLYAVIGLADASALRPRENAAVPSPRASAWRPKSKDPQFFNLRVDDKCSEGEAASACPFAGYAIRLQGGNAIATPYNKWWDPKLPMLFVDDDTKCYTVSKKPLQLYVNTVDGSLRYAPVGWLPANSVAISFYKTGDNPEGLVDPSPAYFSWPSTEGRTNQFFAGSWWLCPMSGTGQYKVYISDYNFGDAAPGGETKEGCTRKSLAAVNADPWG